MKKYEYIEGPEAFRRFDDAMGAMLSKPRPEPPKCDGATTKDAAKPKASEPASPGLAA